MDIPKFIELLMSRRLWLSNAEVLAADDPYEGLPGAVQFAPRMWRSLDEVPEVLRSQILQIYGERSGQSADAVFKSWIMVEEQRCFMTQSGRRNFYLNCWHAADHESVADRRSDKAAPLSPCAPIRLPGCPGLHERTDTGDRPGPSRFCGFA
jgi:hypothetical protein